MCKELKSAFYLQKKGLVGHEIFCFFYALLLMLLIKFFPSSTIRRCSSNINFFYLYHNARLASNIMQIDTNNILSSCSHFDTQMFSWAMIYTVIQVYNSILVYNKLAKISVIKELYYCHCMIVYNIFYYFFSTLSEKGCAVQRSGPFQMK